MRIIADMISKFIALNNKIQSKVRKVLKVYKVESKYAIFFNFLFNQEVNFLISGKMLE